MIPPALLKQGLCSACRHAQTVTSAKNSVFILCLKSREDASFRKYPALPVTNCRGYEKDPAAS